jgi:hypothetical protein
VKITQPTDSAVIRRRLNLNSHQQHQLRRKFHRRHPRHESQRDSREHQQDGGRDVDPPRQQRGAGQHRQQDQKDLKLGFHDRPPSQGKTARSMQGARAAHE